MAIFRSGSLMHGSIFLKIFMKNILPLPAARPLLDAISSGRVYCHCGIDRSLPELIHDAGCLWQRYMEEIYRVGRTEDARQAEKNPKEVCRSHLHEKGKLG